MKYLIYILFLGLLMSCNKDRGGFIIYRVKAHHAASKIPERGFLPGWNKNSLDFWFKTNDTWIWTNEYTSPPGWAKIAGLSNGFNHRKDSYRLGYKYRDNYMILGLFVEYRSQYTSKILDTIQSDAQYYCRLSIEDGYYVARINNREVKIKCQKDKKMTYRLYPHMPGDYNLNWDWVVPIKWKK